MPEQAIHKIMAAQTPADAAQMAMIECLRGIADGNKKLTTVLEGVQVEVRDVRERLIRIEASEFKTEIGSVKSDVQNLEMRVDALEHSEHRREGERSAANWLFKNWPGIVAWLAMIGIVLVANGRVSL